MSIYNVFTFIYVLLLVVVVIKCQSCVPLIGSNSKCSCSYSDGTVSARKIDFSPLAKNDGSPGFAYQVSGDYKYAYNPCYPFSDGAACKDVAACQESNNGQYKYGLGNPNGVSYSVVNSDIVLTYTEYDTAGRTVEATFHCDETALTKATYDPKGDTGDKNKFLFTIGTCLACPRDIKGCHTTAGGGGKLTGGGVICIIFTVLVVVYLVGGILFQKFGRGATGKEMIPNYGFWSDFPFLVKDGFMFLIGLCRGGAGSSDYESIK